MPSEARTGERRGRWTVEEEVVLVDKVFKGDGCAGELIPAPPSAIRSKGRDEER